MWEIFYEMLNNLAGAALISYPTISLGFLIALLLADWNVPIIIGNILIIIGELLPVVRCIYLRANDPKGLNEGTTAAVGGISATAVIATLIFLYA